MSSVGKGIASASIAKLLQARGYNSTCVKADPYINVDAGTMNPTEHGEVFVTDSGDECDQDIGNYERFLNTHIGSSNYMTTGRVYQSVIERERNLEYGGKCVEVIPHIPREIIRRIECASKESNAEITTIEIGGTVGEYQNQLFLEAGRMMKLENPDDVMFVMVSYLPVPGNVGEMKTKPTQFAMRTLNSSGIQADILLARAPEPLDDRRKEKLSVFCNLTSKNIISAPDVDSIYDIPINFMKEDLDERIIEILNLPSRSQRNGELAEWREFSRKTKSFSKKIKIGVIGKYFKTGDYILGDVYVSVLHAIKHAAWAQSCNPEIEYISSDHFEGENLDFDVLDNLDGIIVPGGFGTRGVDGIINVIRYSRERGIPLLGICYGMQLICVEYSRNVAEIMDANTEEVDENSKNLIIHVMQHQKKHLSEQKYGGTMRLGAYPCKLEIGSIAASLYTMFEVQERHRHRLEFNNNYREKLESAGLRFSGLSPDGSLVEIVEVSNHPFLVGCQFHPEFLSRPMHPHPLFHGLLSAAIIRSKKVELL